MPIVFGIAFETNPKALSQNWGSFLSQTSSVLVPKSRNGDWDATPSARLTAPVANAVSQYLAAFEDAGIEEYLEHVVVGLARFLESGCTIAR